LKLSINMDSWTTVFFNSSLQIIHGNGNDILFWFDPWLEGSRLVDRWPDLVAVVPLCRRRKLTLELALRDGGWIRDISRPLTVPIILQYLDAQQCIDPIHLHADEPDHFVWRWTASEQYNSISAYKAMFVGESSIMGVKELWKTRAPNRCRFFIWLSLHGRCWMTGRLFKHGLRSEDTCALCSKEIETSDHLLCQCFFSTEIWFKVLRRAGWQHLTLWRSIFKQG
jgi:hypothetical protein